MAMIGWPRWVVWAVTVWVLGVQAAPHPDTYCENPPTVEEYLQEIYDQLCLDNTTEKCENTRIGDVVHNNVTAHAGDDISLICMVGSFTHSAWCDGRFIETREFHFPRESETHDYEETVYKVEFPYGNDTRKMPTYVPYDHMPAFVGRLFNVTWFKDGVRLTDEDFEKNCTVQNCSGYVLEMAGRSLVIADSKTRHSGSYKCHVTLRERNKECCGCKQDDSEVNFGFFNPLQQRNWYGCNTTRGRGESVCPPLKDGRFGVFNVGVNPSNEPKTWKEEKIGNQTFLTHPWVTSTIYINNERSAPQVGGTHLDLDKHYSIFAAKPNNLSYWWGARDIYDTQPEKVYRAIRCVHEDVDKANEDFYATGYRGLEVYHYVEDGDDLEMQCELDYAIPFLGNDSIEWTWIPALNKGHEPSVTWSEELKAMKRRWSLRVTDLRNHATHRGYYGNAFSNHSNNAYLPEVNVYPMSSFRCRHVYDRTVHAGQRENAMIQHNIEFRSLKVKEEQISVAIDDADLIYNYEQWRDPLHVCATATIPKPAVPSRLMASLIMLHKEWRDPNVFYPLRCPGNPDRHPWGKPLCKSPAVYNRYLKPGFTHRRNLKAVRMVWGPTESDRFFKQGENESFVEQKFCFFPTEWQEPIYNISDEYFKRNISKWQHPYVQSEELYMIYELVCRGLASLTYQDTFNRGENHMTSAGLWMFRVWFTNHPEQAVNATFKVSMVFKREGTFTCDNNKYLIPTEPPPTKPPKTPRPRRRPYRPKQPPKSTPTPAEKPGDKTIMYGFIVLGALIIFVGLIGLMVFGITRCRSRREKDLEMLEARTIAKCLKRVSLQAHGNPEYFWGESDSPLGGLGVELVGEQEAEEPLLGGEGDRPFSQGKPPRLPPRVNRGAPPDLLCMDPGATDSTSLLTPLRPRGPALNLPWRGEGQGSVLPTMSVAVESGPESDLVKDSEYLIPLDRKWEIEDGLNMQSLKLGEGEFGVVHQARFTGRVNGRDYDYEPVAVKSLKESARDDDLITLLGELLILKHLNFPRGHVNVLQLIGAQTQDGPVRVVTELCLKGNLRDLLRAAQYKEFDWWSPSCDDGALSKAKLANFCYQIAEGMAFIAEKRIVHRDLATRNVLVTSADVLRIADFGMTRECTVKDYYRSTGGKLIPVKWMAPEFIMKGVYEFKSDVWSYGVVLWEIFALGADPYPGLSSDDTLITLKSGHKMQPPHGTPHEIKTLMTDTWRVVDQRPSFYEIAPRINKIRVDMYQEKLDKLTLETSKQIELIGGAQEAAAPEHNILMTSEDDVKLTSQSNILVTSESYAEMTSEETPRVNVMPEQNSQCALIEEAQMTSEQREHTTLTQLAVSDAPTTTTNAVNATGAQIECAPLCTKLAKNNAQNAPDSQTASSGASGYIDATREAIIAAVIHGVSTQNDAEKKTGTSGTPASTEKEPGSLKTPGRNDFQRETKLYRYSSESEDGASVWRNNRAPPVGKRSSATNPGLLDDEVDEEQEDKELLGTEEVSKPESKAEVKKKPSVKSKPKMEKRFKPEVPPRKTEVGSKTDTQQEIGGRQVPRTDAEKYGEMDECNAGRTKPDYLQILPDTDTEDANVTIVSSYAIPGSPSAKSTLQGSPPNVSVGKRVKILQKSPTKQNHDVSKKSLGKSPPGGTNYQIPDSTYMIPDSLYRLPRVSYGTPKVSGNQQKTPPDGAYQIPGPPRQVVPGEVGAGGCVDKKRKPIVPRKKAGKLCTGGGGCR